jgi:hypothetical protein
MLLLLLYCFHLFVNSIHNVPPQEEVVDSWHKNESKQMLAFGHLQGMQF